MRAGEELEQWIEVWHCEDAVNEGKVSASKMEKKRKKGTSEVRCLLGRNRLIPTEEYSS